jgi:hypothetical protein
MREDLGWGSFDLAAANRVPTGVARLAKTGDAARDEHGLAGVLDGAIG